MNNMAASDEQYGVSNMETPKPNEDPASNSTLFNLSYKIPPINEPQRYL
jgi:hypothetical protein